MELRVSRNVWPSIHTVFPSSVLTYVGTEGGFQFAFNLLLPYAALAQLAGIFSMQSSSPPVPKATTYSSDLESSYGQFIQAITYTCRLRHVSNSFPPSQRFSAI